MNQIFSHLWNDEAGFIVAGELVLITTIGVLSLVVGLSEVSSNINQELSDLGSAIGSMNQSHHFNGNGGNGNGGHGKGHNKGHSSGSNFSNGSNGPDLVGSLPPTGEN